ncbi:hypothetical protein WN51_02245 [Melipona quadrifasciata]|uniref:Uncharacterized protein n=1 Tax=Melipona quadrifasciata TaxID=166423 RepID=A0A0N1IT75_9HYME|nr:hypothetical protein WN51_02245 [Melipona quadrifasciata]
MNSERISRMNIIDEKVRFKTSKTTVYRRSVRGKCRVEKPRCLFESLPRCGLGGRATRSKDNIRQYRYPVYQNKVNKSVARIVTQLFAEEIGRWGRDVLRNTRRVLI